MKSSIKMICLPVILMATIACSNGPNRAADSSNKAPDERAALGGISRSFAAGGLTLTTGQSVTLSDASYYLIMQTDGNLVFYHSTTALWASNTSGRCTSCEAAFQSDGNLVIYNLSNRQALFATSTSGFSSSTLRLASVQPYLEIASGPRALWASETALCGANVVNNTSVDAGPTLQACIQSANSSGLNLVELVAGRYYLEGTLNITGLSNLTIRTQGVLNGPACLDAGASNCAVLTAMPTNPGPTLFLSDQNASGVGASALVLDHIALDGNIAPRRTHYNSSSWASYSTRGRFADNAMIHGCSGCQFYGFTSTRSAQGSGLEYTGDNAVFNGVYFFENGWGATAYTADHAWSDGLTLLSSANAQVINSKFIDNSDVDLVIGGAPNGVISGNLIQNHQNFSFAGLMFDNFNNSQSGNFTNATISNNTIDCSTGMCGIGLGLGPHLWYNSNSIVGTGAVVENNYITGAKQGLLTYGANGFTLKANTEIANGAYAANNFNGCTAKPISITPGDNIDLISNNYMPGVPAGYNFSNLLEGCSPNNLPGMVVDIAGVAYTIAVDYRDILDRDPDVAGGRSYTADLNQGVSNYNLRVAMADSTEAYNLLNSLYEKYLGRSIDSAGLANYRAELASGSVSIDTLRVILQLSPEALSNPYRVY